MLKRKKLPSSKRDIKQLLLNAMFDKNHALAMKKTFEVLYRRLSLNSPDLEIKKFLKYGSLPFSLYMEENEACSKTIEILDKVVYEDVAKLENFEREILDKMFKILLLLAESPSVNFQTISSYVEISKHTVSRIINAFEKADVLFSLKPLGSESKLVRKSWKYYFTAPVMRFALKKSVGLFKERDIGLLFEDYIASVFKRIKETNFPALEIFYDPYKNGSDFVLVLMDKKIPVEVGFGKKESKGIKQVKTSMKRYNASHGILISDSNFRVEDDIIFIPKEFFLWV
jgi:predicted AAA+ superfamily ATPase